VARFNLALYVKDVSLFIAGILDHLLLICAACFGIFYFGGHIKSSAMSVSIKADSPKLSKGLVIICWFLLLIEFLKILEVI